MAHLFLRVAAVFVVCFALGACASAGKREVLAQAPEVVELTPSGLRLAQLPPPSRKVDVAVYAFPDLTGQHKPNDNFTEYSRAVTQGSNAFLVEALQEAGQGSWFSVVERGGLQNLLQERQIISVTRQQFGDQGALPPLRFAGILIEGGVIGYDSNTITGGAGARYLGIGGNTEYRRDTVTVGLRAVSVQSGEVLESITVTKTIYSAAAQGAVFRFVAVDELLEIEAGVTRNEPTTLAVREAIELGVFALVLEGAKSGNWSFANPADAAPFIEAYNKRHRPILTASAR